MGRALWPRRRARRAFVSSAPWMASSPPAPRTRTEKASALGIHHTFSESQRSPFSVARPTRHIGRCADAATSRPDRRLLFGHTDATEGRIDAGRVGGNPIADTHPCSPSSRLAATISKSL